ncbi:PLDc N-terminal domain-containing protein [Ruminiclostridium herbifermentans]|uniref:PLDc N-terminal domain-containing protein n=1 Tax=Ruminiclostridium herbifermentans TaxID=2488810 RepID=A0A4V6EPS1_9FIRM|nr:PLDc N-terminal domain-containing protein [Ruminiclostridium herbifermentans]QNU67075.1 PLDc N-terminal domain-containing protein [Ruminiclostridium herbifermentans]
MPFDIKLVIPYLVVEIILKIFALVDLYKCDIQRLRLGKKFIWVLIILFINIFGPIGYFIFAKKND